MKTNVIRVGNSCGIRLPKAVLAQYGWTANVPVEIIAKNDFVVIKPLHSVRQGWREAFARMAKKGDDHLLIPDDIQNEWDLEEWEWK